jgi:hypothetical protein
VRPEEREALVEWLRRGPARLKPAGAPGGGPGAK